MRTFCLAAAVAFALVSPALAQSVYDGPLASPDAPATAAPAAPRHAKSKPKKIRHAAAKPAAAKPAAAKPAAAKPTADAAFAAPATGGAPTSEGAPPARKSVADDPLSLDMKWQGNNDSVSQTRSQNLDGNAYGSGAEVGMKLHF